MFVCVEVLRSSLQFIIETSVFNTNNVDWRIATSDLDLHCLLMSLLLDARLKTG